MTWALFAAFAGLALVDSLNPFTVAAQVYLLGTPKPMARSLAFLATTFIAYFFGGVLLIEGWAAIFQYIVPFIPYWGIGASEVGLGIVLGVTAIWAWRKTSSGAPFQPPEHL
ncbi:GAP family protein, partial [Nostoc sp. CHAB 5824]|nr:GAP family protein [Nostoc sp. CHAB 5824]